MLFLFLGNWWNALASIEQVFWGIAIIFSILFIIQFVLSLIGLDFDHDVDLDTHVDVTHVDSFQVDSDFTLLSVRSIIAFFTFFGWTGILVLNAGGTLFATLGFSTLSGLASMFIVGYMMYAFSKLEQQGNMDINEALYNTGEVYLPIPSNKNGQGKIHINIQGSIREMDAVTKGSLLPTGSKVRVIDIMNNELLVVEPLESLQSETNS